MSETDGKTDPPRRAVADLLCDALHPETRVFSKWSSVDWEDLSWNLVLEVARRNKVDGLLVGRMDDAGFSHHVPEEVGPAFDEIRAAGARSHERYSRTVQDLRGTFERDAIPFLVVKGDPFAEAAYGCPPRTSTSLSGVATLNVPRLFWFARVTPC